MLKTFKTLFILFILSFITLYTNCKNDTINTDNSFILKGRNSYFVDSYNGISIYRDNDNRKPLNGYYVIANESTKWEEFNVENGILNGDYISYHNNGKKFSEAKYIKGKLHGEEKTYSITGALSKLSTYRHGVRYGETITYYNNGNIESKSKIENEKTVESVSFDLIGNIESQMFIKDGRSITQTIVGGKVQVEQISSNYDSFEAMKLFNEDGSLKVFLRMLDEGDKSYLIELDENEDELKRIDVKANPQEAMKYFQYLPTFN